MLLINGQWVAGGEQLPVRNPFTGSIVGMMTLATRQQASDAARYAKAFESDLAAGRRAEILNGTAADIEREADAYAEQIVSECGTCIKEAQKEVRRAITQFRICAEETTRLRGEAIPLEGSAHGPQQLAVTIRVPVGLVCAITPFNRPLNQVAVKLGPAIASNNSVILKPSEKAPLSAIRLVKCLIRNGLPAGMVSLVTGDPLEVGDALVTNSHVDMITFTGSRAVGERIARRAGMVKLALELGDSGALIVLKDANLDNAARAAASGAFSTAGQSCRGVKRLLVEDSVADQFGSLLVRESKRLNFGDPSLPLNDFGCLIHESAAVEVERRVSAAIESGAVPLLLSPRMGAVLGPQVLDHVPRHCELVREETFGPCAPIVRVQDLEDAVSYINCGDYGLQTGVFTSNIQQALRAAQEIRSGAVIINGGPQFESPFIPFGGVKKSGIGREGPRFAMQEMTTVRTVVW
ncbi:MAG: aldehyde dehydrogenase family protein [Alphaproteobacteria bacterium]